MDLLKASVPIWRPGWREPNFKHRRLPCGPRQRRATADNCAQPPWLGGPQGHRRRSGPSPRGSSSQIRRWSALKTHQAYRRWPSLHRRGTQKIYIIFIHLPDSSSTSFKVVPVMYFSKIHKKIQKLCFYKSQNWEIITFGAQSLELF